MKSRRCKALRMEFRGAALRGRIFTTPVVMVVNKEVGPLRTTLAFRWLCCTECLSRHRLAHCASCWDTLTVSLATNPTKHRWTTVSPSSVCHRSSRRPSRGLLAIFLKLAFRTQKSIRNEHFKARSEWIRSSEHKVEQYYWG